MNVRTLRRLAVAASLVSALALGGPPVSIGIAAEAVDLNAATVEQLVALPGVGPAKAKAIVEYREQQRFRSIDELRNVPGIGGATFERLKDQVKVAD